MSEAESELVVNGHVKWFNKTKGFGFISVSGYPDILLHANALKSYGQSAVADNAPIEAVIRQTGRGYQVQEVLRIDEPDLPEEVKVTNAYGLTDEFLESLEIHPARVKWFSDAKGFGFVNVFGSTQDIFIHSDVLRMSSLGTVSEGDAIAVRFIEGQRGLTAVQALSWLATAEDEETDEDEIEGYDDIEG